MEGVNSQQGTKRLREDGTLEDDPPLGSFCGKDAAKLLIGHASKPLAALRTQLFKRAAALRKKRVGSSAAVATLQSAMDKNEVAPTLHLRRSPALKAIFEAKPELAAQTAGIESEAHKFALEQRQQEHALLELELTAICTGDTFLTAAKDSLRLDRFTAAEQAVLEQEITAAETVFKLELKLKFFEFEDKEAKAAAAKQKRLEDREVRRMEIEQEPSAALMKRMVDAAIAKRLGGSAPRSRRASPSPRRVTFATGKPQQGQSASRSQSRGRSSSRGTSRDSSHSASRSASRGHSHERSQTPFPNRGKGQQRRHTSRGGGGSASRPHSRGPSPSPRASREPRRYHGRDFSQGNGRGGRGARPHRPPSDRQGGSARVGDGGGSRTGPRR